MFGFNEIYKILYMIWIRSRDMSVKDFIDVEESRLLVSENQKQRAHAIFQKTLYRQTDSAYFPGSIPYRTDTSEIGLDGYFREIQFTVAHFHLSGSIFTTIFNGISNTIGKVIYQSFSQR